MSIYVLICLLATISPRTFYFFFFFNDTATTEIYTLSLHDALPIWYCSRSSFWRGRRPTWLALFGRTVSIATNATGDRKSTRLNSSHSQISYAVFCLKKKKKISFIYLILAAHE